MLFVSALFDLASKEKSDRRSPDEFYYQHGAKLLSMDLDIVIFAEKKLMSKIKEIKSGKGIRDYIEIELEDLPDYEHREIIESVRKNRGGWNNEKDTPLFTVVQWSKIKFVQLAMGKYNHSHVVWIDFGINHIVDLQQRLFDGMKKFDKVRICSLRPTFPEEFSENFFRGFQGRTAGGIISFPRDIFSQVHEAWEYTKYEFIKKQICPLEDEIFTFLRVTYDEFFSSYFGAYPDLLRNFNGEIYSNLGTLHIAIFWCKLMGRVDALEEFFNTLRDNIANLEVDLVDLVELMLNTQNYIHRNK